MMTTIEWLPPRSQPHPPALGSPCGQLCGITKATVVPYREPALVRA